MKKVLAVLGTRPETIKMAPVLAELRSSDQIDLRLCVTAQHRQMLDQAMSQFQLRADHDLDLMRHDQSLDELTAAALVGIGKVLDAERPDLVLVHGDTATTFAATLAAFYRQVKIAHVEAGLRSGSLYMPWPEELYRRMVSLAATLHLAPTETARRNLLAEGVPEDTIVVTGNTVIDALVDTADRLRDDADLRRQMEQRFGFLRSVGPLALVSIHRRENFGEPLRNICKALAGLASTHGIEIVFPVHPNPHIAGPVEQILAHNPLIHLIEPVDHQAFVYLMDRADLVITDSGGVQEEAPTLGTPVLVLRDLTERPEAVASGKAALVGSSSAAIMQQALAFLRAPAQARKGASLYGDGKAAGRIRHVLETWLGS